MLDVRDVRVIADERAARTQLRGQIAALEASSPTPSSARSRTAGRIAPSRAPAARAC